MSSPKKRYGFWVERPDRYSQTVGTEHTVEGEIELCKNALHASPTIKEADAHIRVKAGRNVALVAISGDVKDGKYKPKGGKLTYKKFGGRNRTVLAKVVIDAVPSDKKKGDFFKNLEKLLNGHAAFNEKYKNFSV